MSIDLCHIAELIQYYGAHNKNVNKTNVYDIYLHNYFLFIRTVYKFIKDVHRF